MAEKKTLMDYSAARDWVLAGSGFDPELPGKCEAVMCQGNGYMGLRCATEERYLGEQRNLFVAGTFNKFDENEVTELPNAPFILAQLGVTDSFDYVCDAAAVERAKPFPDIFLVAAQHVGADPAACVGVEDAEAGIRAINAAGMFSVGVGTPDQMREAKLILSGTHERSLARIREASGLA